MQTIHFPNSQLMIRIVFVLSICFICACSSDSGTSIPTGCINTAADSQDDGSNGLSLRIRSHQSTPKPVYYYIEGVRELSNGTPVDIDYMIHLPTGSAKAILVLIAGGGLTANIEGSPSSIAGDGLPVQSAGGNFLVRSAHLYAQRGYLVVTIDRPTDLIDGLASSAYDSYRVSMRHAVDIARIVNRVKSETHSQYANLPVVLVGTSRGAISAVSQGLLAEAVAVSSPLTSGQVYPVGSTRADPSRINQPAHVLWHASDSCTYTLPTGSSNLVGDFPNGSGDEVSGGFLGDTNICGAFHYHGFFGIESCALQNEVNWMNTINFSVSRPTASLIQHANPAQPIDLSIGVTGGSGTLQYALHLATDENKSSLGGSLSITGNNVTYTPPAVIDPGTVDTFVFVVTDENGGRAFHVVEVTN